MQGRAAGRAWLVGAALVSLLVVPIAPAPEAAAAPDPNPPGGFTESTVVGGAGILTLPTAARFAPDGRIFVAEKRGTIKVFDGPGDTAPATFADLRTEVYNFLDRGLLGLEIDPDFPTRPYIYALYSRDAPVGGTAPTWGGTADDDSCPNPPGAGVDGCVTSGRLVRLTATWDPGNTTWVLTGEPLLLLDDWCEQFITHSVGTVMFGPDGALYVGGGEGAASGDIGQHGWPAPENLNPCGDPPGGVGTLLTAPTSEGGVLRAQDALTPADPQTLDGTIARIDPDTGAALPDNPWAGEADANRARLVAYGLRNPYRFTFRPGAEHTELWVGDVGAGKYEEILRLHEMDEEVENFGWPCYEGPMRASYYDNLDLDLCETLYAAPGSTAAAYWTYQHDTPVVPGETCPTSSTSISGLAFYAGGDYPDSYDGALFFTDYARSCIWVMFPGADGLPDPETLRTFRSDAVTPVELQIGPGGDLYYVDLWGGRLARIAYQPGTPTALFTTDVTYGPLPLTVAFDGTGSSDPEGGPLTYEWDLDGDGAYDDSTSPTPSQVYTAREVVPVALRVTDSEGKTDVAGTRLWPGDSPPTATITAPAWHDTPEGPVADTQWAVGDTIAYAGNATDAEDGPLAGSQLTWDLRMRECEGDSCHAHPLVTHTGSGGSLVIPEPDHPGVVEITLTATDSAGLTSQQTVRVDPRTVELTLASDPPGLQLDLGDESGAAPLVEEAIVGTHHTVGAPSPQILGGGVYAFASWSDGGGAYHDLTVPDTPLTLTATFERVSEISVLPVGGSVTEGDSGSTTLDVLVELSQASSETVTVDWETVDTLTQPEAGVDYESASGTVTFVPGDTSETVPITVYGDALDEGDPTYQSEWGVVRFSSPTNAGLAPGWGQMAFATIVDDDASPTIVPGGNAVLEGDAGTTVVEVPVTLSAPSGLTVTVDWATIDTLAQPEAGVDYVSAAGTVTFTPGDTSETVPITVYGDTLDEPGALWDAEWGALLLSAPTNATFAGGWFGRIGLFLVVDDD